MTYLNSSLASAAPGPTQIVLAWTYLSNILSPPFLTSHLFCPQPRDTKATNANNDTVSDLTLILRLFFRSEDLGLRKGVGHAAQGLNPLIKRRVEERAGEIGGWQFLKYTLLIH